MCITHTYTFYIRQQFILNVSADTYTYTFIYIHFNSRTHAFVLSMRTYIIMHASFILVYLCRITQVHTNLFYILKDYIYLNIKIIFIEYAQHITELCVHTVTHTRCNTHFILCSMYACKQVH